MEITQDSVCVIHNCANMRKMKIDGVKKFYCDGVYKCSQDDGPVPTGHVYKITECNNVQTR